jgi:hypothetical protein
VLATPAGVAFETWVAMRAPPAASLDPLPVDEYCTTPLATFNLSRAASSAGVLD